MFLEPPPGHWRSPFHLHGATSKPPGGEIFASVGHVGGQKHLVGGVGASAPSWHAVRAHPAPSRAMGTQALGTMAPEGLLRVKILQLLLLRGCFFPFLVGEKLSSQSLFPVPDPSPCS